ncbi:hypothetical protein SAMN05421823_1227 [Catalinimonas alkaloidigena]|uniref:Copper-resistance protein, CopA family n=1 Tax=Catalinimonas alkaloidigena TaxID=1075417 RepID=A0A1G9VMN5_9BACT|nr:multicopper oxidase domain-containing protein [Catalinimonas alkaloidigena]SDM73367.1 hypothetical protein SAMN05421823_1227 [Catalinimonas alkaloidigena]
MKPYYLSLFIALFFLVSPSTWAQPDTMVYHLTIDQAQVSKVAGKQVNGMTVNGTIPGPTLRFPEGAYAVIYVQNNMDVETSVHWHGLLVPNFYDGVPYLTTPPIEPGTTFKYEFPLKQAGTYWYHSHTMLQEQSGVYGSIVIEPKVQQLAYNKELVVVFSDWTNEKPGNVMRNLKRGNEWYNIRKGTATPLNRVIARGGFGAQLNFWRQRMESADIADIYYPAFLTNGEQTQQYPEFEPGDRVRVRFINAAASSQFWITFGGEDPLLIAADGLDVVPVVHNKTFIAVAETYDFIVTLPATGQLEIRATAQDGSGQTSAFLGQGPLLAAPDVPRPDKIGMMKQMAQMDMRMGAPAMKFNPNKVTPYELMHHWGMQMEPVMEHSAPSNSSMHSSPTSPMPEEKQRMSMKQSSVTMGTMAHDHMDQDQHAMPQGEQSSPVAVSDSTPSQEMVHFKMNHARLRVPQYDTMSHHAAKKEEAMRGMSMPGNVQSNSGISMPGMEMPGMEMFAEYNYDYLKSPEKTSFSNDKPVQEILLNLTGNMWRYIWSLNGVPLNESDQLKIKKGEVVRITLNNLTMMHHPMHLHGHFFRVINKNGAYSPLKHTVNVPPMQKVVIEFDANEYGDWFFHCHVLYHLNGGMARIFSYDTPRDKRLLDAPLVNLVNEANQFFTWGTADVASHMTEINLISSNIRNQFNVSVEYGWNKNLEAEVSYERYLYDYFRVFGGINLENKNENSLNELTPTAVIGFRFFTPYMFNLDARIDNQLRPEIRLSREIMVFPRTAVFGTYEYQANFGWINYSNDENRDGRTTYQGETTWSAGVEYFLSRNFSLMASYDNRFGAGGGLSIRF